MRRLSFSVFFSLAALTGAACLPGGGLTGPAGDGDGDGDGDVSDVDASTPEGMCELMMKGLANLQGYFSMSIAAQWQCPQTDDVSTELTYEDADGVERAFEIDADSFWLGDGSEYLDLIIEENCAPGAEYRDLWEDIFANPNVSFDQAAIEACVSEGRAARADIDLAVLRGEETIDTFEEEDVVFGEDICGGLTTGTLPEGSPCTYSIECEGDLSCQLDLDTADVYCQPRAEQGAACGSFSGAQSTTYSRTCDEGLQCVAGVCEMPGGVGATCGTNYPGCEGELSCNQEFDPELGESVGTCEPDREEGESCADGEPCADALFCGGDDGEEVCLPRVARGEACGPDDWCASSCDVCRPDEDGELRCQPQGVEGDPCDSFFGHCSNDFFCHGVDRVCAPLREEGEACGGEDDALCVAGTSCDHEQEPPTCVVDDVDAGCQADGSCGVGETCSGDFQCEDPLICIEEEAAGEETCQEPPAVGEPCLNGACGEGAFCDENDECAALLEVGDECTLDAQCEYGCVQPAGVCGEAFPVGGCEFDGGLPSILFYATGLFFFRRRRLARIRAALTAWSARR